MKDMKLTINGKDYKVKIENFGSEEAIISVDGEKYTVGLKDLGIEKAPDIALQAQGTVPVSTGGTKAPRMASAPVSTGAAPKAATAASSGNVITAPLPGLIMDIKVKEGDTITSGQNVMIMEAMKMENHIPATMGGVIQSIDVKVGDSVSEGQVLLTLE